LIALNKALRRRTVGELMHYRRPIIVELIPGDVIRLRMFGQRVASSVSIRIQDLYFELADRKRRNKESAPENESAPGH
jgi:hypothetical protein